MNKKLKKSPIGIKIFQDIEKTKEKLEFIKNNKEDEYLRL